MSITDIGFLVAYVDGQRHRIEITGLSASRLDWCCVTCKRAGVTTAGYRGADLIRQARTNHYQQVRNAARLTA